MSTFYAREGVTIYCGDCLELMPELAESSIDLIVTDPPYYRVKDEPWDRQWDMVDGFIEWIDKLCAEWYRLLRPNGSLYVFASPEMAARVEVKVGERFRALNRIRWIKEAGWHRKTVKEALRAYLSPWEEIIFAEHYNSDNAAKGESGYGVKCDELRGFVFEPLRTYLVGEFKRAGIKFDQANEFCGTASMAAGHYFSHSQWCLPTAEHYKSLQDGLNRNGSHEYLCRDYEYLCRDYESLRAEYESLRVEYESLRRPFSVSVDVPYTDVWDFPTVKSYPGKHPCEKPIQMLEHIINTSSRPGAVVLDTCMGSGTTLVAAQNLGRKAIGMDLDKQWCNRAIQRLNQVQQLSFVA